ncbi:MAG: DUF799 domain-containing protein [Deltaproteobacteria bacterium]|nr:DUF799 domain-containing protein [Deltaproteobacteria bacterium]
MKRAFVLILGLFLLIVGCGYNFRGGQNNLPPDVRSVAIPLFKNRTAEVGIESTFTNEVIYQFTRSQMVRVTAPSEADAVLYGEITRVTLEDIAFTSQDSSQETRVTVYVAAKLVRTRDGKTLWRANRLSKNRNYRVTGSTTATDDSRGAAITLVAQDLAQTLHDSIFENF